MAKNSQQNSALDMIRGKKACEQVFRTAVSKVRSPARTTEQQQRVIGKQWGPSALACIYRSVWSVYTHVV